MAEKFNVWEGIYRSFQEAASAAAGPGFNGDVWCSRSKEAANECFAWLKAGKPIPSLHKERSTMLPPVAAMMLINNDRLRVLDFGGGLGIGYMTLAESIVRCDERISYTIVEKDAICTFGRELFSGKKNVEYLGSLPSQGKFDLVHSASALQYVDDWQKVLMDWKGYGPQYILLSDVVAGAIPSFVTLQNYYGSRIPCWMWNLNELLDVFSRVGYQLLMKCFVNSSRLGHENILPMDNFPENHRAGLSLHLLFRRGA